MGYSNQVLDFLGVGLGPNHLSLAICLDELLPVESRKVLFVEKQTATAWHPGMMLPGTTLQTSFLKDLVTLRNPTSRYSFLNYYHHIDRLHEFINLRTFYPTRLEFSQYLSWVSSEFAHWTRYGTKVLEVLPVTNAHGVVETLKVVWEDTKTGRLEHAFTRNLGIAAGHTPKFPDCFAKLKSPKVFHSDHFMDRVQELPEPESSRRVVIVGAGQSAVEILHWFMDNRPQDTVTLIVSKFALSPANSSHFVNEAYGPSFEDYCFELPEAQRDHLIEMMQNTNYGVADPDILESLYRRLYQLKTLGKEPVRILNSSRVETATDSPDAIELDVRNKFTDTITHHQADLVVVATGYETSVPVNLTALEPYLLRDRRNRYVQDRDYSITTEPNFEPRIYLQGYGEHRFGLTEVTLSILPQRAERITKSVCLGLQRIAEEFPNMMEVAASREV